MLGLACSAGQEVVTEMDVEKGGKESDTCLQITKMLLMSRLNI